MRAQIGRRIIRGSEIEVTIKGNCQKRGWRRKGQNLNLVNGSISRAGREGQSRMPGKNTEKDPLESIKKEREEYRVMVSGREAKKS